MIVLADFEGGTAGGGFFVADPGLVFSLVFQQEENVVGDLSVDLEQDGLIQGGLIQTELQHLHLGDGLSGGQVGRGESDFVPPPDDLDLLCKGPL